MRFEFLCLPMNKRRNAVREAQTGGSVPPQYMEELHRLSQESSALTLEVDDSIDHSQVSVDGDGERVVINGEPFAMAILATGVVTAPSIGDSSPLYSSVKKLLNAPTVEGLPCVNPQMRWVPQEDVRRPTQQLPSELESPMSQAPPRRPFALCCSALRGDSCSHGIGRECLDLNLGRFSCSAPTPSSSLAPEAAT